MKLIDVLRMHDEARVERGLPGSLGDSYLIRHNPVYSVIRERVLAAGFSCTTEDFCHYAVLPYAALESILARKKIPYFDNVSVLRAIEDKHPGKFLIDELVQVKANYVLHESAHCLADDTIRGLRIEAPGFSADQRSALALMMAESFANSVEALANVPNATAETRFFHESNSYIVHDKRTSTAFRHALDLLGPRAAYRLLFLGYLHANCLLPEPGPKQYQELLELTLPAGEIRRKAQDSPHVKKFFQYAFELNMAFRLQTTGFYLAHAGIRGDVRQLLHVNLAALYKNQSFIRDFLDKTENISG